MSVYLITGFTGTLGSELTRRLLSQGHKVRGVARGEHRIEALRKSIPEEHLSRLSPFVGDVRDRWRMWRAFDGVEYVIHGAALKVVGRCEYDPEEAIRTNIDGTASVINACLDTGVKRAVFISSDKACAPHNLYGMTKATGERLWIAANRYSAGKGTEFVAVRWGNVFSSNGSVIPVWREQMKKGPITITDAKCTRFHFQLPAAIDFLFKALHEANPGDLRVPLLPSYLLRDLAEAIAPGHPRKIIGLQPGEKRHELMINSHESVYAKQCEGFYTITPGVIQDGNEFEYNSSTNTWRLSIEDLRKEFAKYQDVPELPTSQT